jgi:pimeloyl-ACP methyl ester carboxylesterase
MTTYVLIPGAGGSAWYWHRLVPELQQRGHDVVAVDLPASDDSAGLTEYADTVVDAVVNSVGHRTELIVVAQSMGGFTGPLVCQRLPVHLLILLNAMVPLPGERIFDWWFRSGHGEARARQAARDGRTLDGEGDLFEDLFHDVPADVRDEALALGEPAQSTRPFAQRWPLNAWPDVPTRFLQGSDDRFLPVEFQRRIVRERLGFVPDEMPGGHLVALSRPKELADRLESYRAEIQEPSSSRT